MEHQKIIEFPVFGYWMYIIYTDDIEASRDKHGDVIGALDEILHPSVDGMHSYNKIRAEGWIFFRPDSTLGTIAHEAFHALWQMFNFIGAEIENETMAYHLGYLVDTILEFKTKIDEAKASPKTKKDGK